ncbi:MAG: hypothetical protein LC739_13830, partial [Actinobacteria bacterium]|nr:hypothetical protein [Actinomycetota bacterium]
MLNSDIRLLLLLFAGHSSKVRKRAVIVIGGVTHMRPHQYLDIGISLYAEIATDRNADIGQVSGVEAEARPPR